MGVAVKLYKFLLFCLPFFLGPVPAQARWEAETDPTAYALDGFSAHLGYSVLDGRARLQLGAFGAETPKWIHGNSGFSQNSRGVSFKFDYFLLRPAAGLFVGVDSNYSRVRYELDRTHECTYRNIAGLGPRAGYRFNLGSHLYVSPWVAVDHQFNTKDATVSGRTFHETKYSVFPAVHLGWRF